MTEMTTGAIPETPKSDSTGEDKVFDKAYVDELKNESIKNRRENKELKARLEALEGQVSVVDKIKAVFGEEKDPNEALNQLISETKTLRAELEEQKVEKLISFAAQNAGVADVELLMSILKGKEVTNKNVEALVNNAIEKHPVLKGQSPAVGVFPKDTPVHVDLKDPQSQSKFMNNLIRSAR